MGVYGLCFCVFRFVSIIGDNVVGKEEIWELSYNLDRYSYGFVGFLRLISISFSLILVRIV